MATRSSDGKVAVNIVGETRDVHPRITPEVPFRIALLGDFSGRAMAGAGSTEDRIFEIDRDNFAEVFARLQVELRIPVLGQKSPPVAIGISEFDGFHPDRLYDHPDLFEPLKETRRSLDDPAVTSAFAKERSVGKPSGAAEPPLRSGTILQQVLDAAEESSRSPPHTAAL